jgi:hypothetical protein
MSGGGDDKMGESGVGGDSSYNTHIRTSTDHGGSRPPTAVMGRDSQLLSIQQSAKIQLDMTTSLQ